MEFFKIRRDIPFMKNALILNVISFLTFAAAVFFLFSKGLHLSVEFTGGTVMEVSYSQAANVEQVRKTVSDLGFADVQVQNFGTSRDVLANRAGVCRDFAHLGVALCRAVNIPARFVFGYTEFPDPPPDFHALFEAYIGNQWVLFDATRMATIDKIVRIGTGTDAKDVAFATIYGDVEMTYMKPLICDHVEGQAPKFAHEDDFIGVASA
ncbi:MAG: hypothetical protein EOO23_03765 [Comamonadaceae bacterium]|nr:MAG: hypothetical protein EOO23_03765 [Comamonadaceae bacterium]